MHLLLGHIFVKQEGFVLLFIFFPQCDGQDRDAELGIDLCCHLQENHCYCAWDTVADTGAQLQGWVT